MMGIIKLIKKLLKVREVWEETYNGIGYIQGNETIFRIKKVKFLGMSLVTDIDYNVSGEWTKKMAQKLTDNWIQEKGHIEYVIKEMDKHRKQSVKESKEESFYFRLLNEKIKEE